ncbi:MAG: hypothetical protein KDH20_01985 [Rhodocyclaceae bacterium]|nr:hypothetical protein [Gammaproteobacteria bacterium]MCB1886352.1 hypothetical protein [Rhodocyclaceae bacterium]
MSRRAFFRFSGRKIVEKAGQALDETVRHDARRWFRPPFARDELTFLTTCTRCQACIDACPEGLIFRLPVSVGVRAAGTPALDLRNRACALCTDWPCVAACEPHALRLPDPPEEDATGADPAGTEVADHDMPAPALAVVSIDVSTCLPYHGPECGACGTACPIPGALRWDGPRPRVDMAHCVGCGQCRVACITEPKAIDVRTIHARTSTP